MENAKPVEVSTTAIGPGSLADDTIAPRPLLEGASEYEYVELLNPLSVDFIAQFGVTRPVQAPIRISSNPQAPGITASESDLKNNYGLDLRNPNHQAKANIVNTVRIPSGKTVRVLGSEAQVIIRQLVTEILARENKKLMLHDPWQRHQVEQRIVIARGSVGDLMGRAPLSVNEQLQQAVKEEHEIEFPNARSQESTGANAGSGEQTPPRPSGDGLTTAAPKSTGPGNSVTHGSVTK